MGDDRGYDWDNWWGVGTEMIQKAGYYNYSSISLANMGRLSCKYFT